MKARVIRTFKDKNTKVIFKAGQEFTVTNERFEEINSTSLGIFVDEIIEAEEKAETAAEEKADNKNAEKAEPTVETKATSSKKKTDK